MLPCAVPAVHLHLGDFFILQRGNNPDPAVVIDMDPAQTDAALQPYLPEACLSMSATHPRMCCSLAHPRSSGSLQRGRWKKLGKHALPTTTASVGATAPAAQNPKVAACCLQLTTLTVGCAALLIPACRFGAHRGDYMWVNTVLRLPALRADASACLTVCKKAEGWKTLAVHSLHPCCCASLRPTSCRFHCHNLVHEDNDMLRGFDMVGGTADQMGKAALNAGTELKINQAAGEQCSRGILNAVVSASLSACQGALLRALRCLTHPVGNPIYAGDSPQHQT